MSKAGDRLFAITWRPGPGWLAGKPVTEQLLDEHRAYFGKLSAEGRVVLAGPFLDERAGGLAVLRADDFDAARAIMESDPAIVAGVFEGDLRPLYVVFPDGWG